MPTEFERDFGFRFLQTQPAGNPLESLDIVSRFLPTIGFVERLRFRRVSSDIGYHPKDFRYVEYALDPDRFRQSVHIVDVHASHR